MLLARALLARPALLVLDDVAGVLDDEARRRVRDVLADATVGVIEATVDTALLTNTTYRIELTS